MIKNQTVKASLLSTATVETAIATLTVPDGHKYNVVEIGTGLPTSTIIYVYIVNERVLTLDASVNNDNRRRVLNWELGAGIQIRVTGINNAGSTQVLGAEFILDDITA